MIKREELTNPQSCMSRARDDEMTFVLLGRDAAAPVVIYAWCAERVRLGKNLWSDPQITEALACADIMTNTRPAASPVASSGTPADFPATEDDDRCYTKLSKSSPCARGTVGCIRSHEFVSHEVPQQAVSPEKK